MNTEEKYGLKKSKAILLFIQMFLVFFQLIVSVYLLIFVIKYNLGAWMISSYIFITISVLSVIFYSIYGYKKNKIYYGISLIPFLIAVFINALLPIRETFQVGILIVLFGLVFGYILKIDDKKYNAVLSISMIIVSLTFSVYSAIKADTQFLGSIDAIWTTYLAMYLSIFIPTIMSSTFALINNVRNDKKVNN